MLIFLSDFISHNKTRASKLSVTKTDRWSVEVVMVEQMLDRMKGPLPEQSFTLCGHVFEGFSLRIC